MTQPTYDDIAYSYIRFSSKRQEAGDSIRRQDTGAKEWAAKNNVRLDTSLKVDKGVSAFRGQNADLGSLGEFLRLVENGRVVRGSYLVVESLDRISRNEVQAALYLVLGILKAGIRIVQLKPVEMIYDDKCDTVALIIMIVELSRGNSESQMKSERVGKARAEERKRIREAKEVVTTRLPAWLEVRDGKIVVIPERAEAVRLIFRLAASGYGIPTILAKLNREKVPPIGRKGVWVRAYVGIVLKDRRAVGEYQPKCGGVPDGPPVSGYYPPVVTEQEFLAARAGAAQRRKSPGRTGKARINVFAGLLRHARDGDTYTMTKRSSTVKGRVLRKFQVLLNSGSEEGRSRAYSIPYDVFETAVLSQLRELDPREILDGDDGPDETLTLAGELATVEADIASIEQELDRHGESATLYKRLRTKEDKKRELAARLAEAQQKAAHPLSAAWGEARSLVDVLANAADPEDTRLRLRSALRRIVESIQLLIVPRGQDRLCGIQVWFAGGLAHRDYLLVQRPASGPRPACWAVKSELHPEEGQERFPFGYEDLRDPKQAARHAGILEKYTAERIERLLAAGVQTD